MSLRHAQYTANLQHTQHYSNTNRFHSTVLMWSTEQWACKLSVDVLWRRGDKTLPYFKNECL